MRTAFAWFEPRMAAASLLGTSRIGMEGELPIGSLESDLGPDRHPPGDALEGGIPPGIPSSEHVSDQKSSSSTML